MMNAKKSCFHLISKNLALKDTQSTKLGKPLRISLEFTATNRNIIRIIHLIINVYIINVFRKPAFTLF